MNQNNIFDVILDSDECIQKIYKPNKLKMFISIFFMFFWMWLFLSLSFVFIILAEANDVYLWLAFLIFSVVSLIIFVLCAWLVFALLYKNTYYAYTNKRLIIRHGIFGIDFKSLDMNMVGAISVDVTLIDKILKRGTGSIYFGSMANPMVNNASLFRFLHINNIYDEYKQIKATIDEQKNSKKI